MPLWVFVDYPEKYLLVSANNIHFLRKHNAEISQDEKTYSVSREYHWRVTIICSSRHEYLGRAPIVSYEHLWKNKHRFFTYFTQCVKYVTKLDDLRSIYEIYVCRLKIFMSNSVDISYILWWYFIYNYLIFMSQIVLYFVHITLVLYMYIDVY